MSAPRQIPFVHSAWQIIGSNSYIYNSILLNFLKVVRSSVSFGGAYLKIAHALLQEQFCSDAL